jgi:hypothetical protein
MGLWKAHGSKISEKNLISCPAIGFVVYLTADTMKIWITDHRIKREKNNPCSYSRRLSLQVFYLR